MAWRQATVSYLLKSDVLMFEWKYSLLSLASKRKRRISSVLILSMEIPLVSQWTMYVRDWSWLYNWKASQPFLFFGGLVSLFAALGLRSLDSKQKFHNLYKVSAIVKMVVTQWYFWWGKFGSEGKRRNHKDSGWMGKECSAPRFCVAYLRTTNKSTF